jgi:hypothetical protein
MKEQAFRRWLREHGLSLEESFSAAVKDLARQYKKAHNLKTTAEVYALAGVKKQHISYWAKHPCSTQTKKFSTSRAGDRQKKPYWP